MTSRSVRASLAALALLLPLGIAGCEEEKGIPAVPDSDVAAVPAENSADAKAPEPAKSAETKQADAKDADAKDADAKDADAKDADAKDADAKDAKTGASDTKTADSKSKPKEEEPEPTVGEKKTEGSYAAWLQSSGKYKVNKPGSVVAVVSAQGEYKCNDKYPYKFKLGAAPSGVTYGAAVARGASIGKKQTSLSIPFTPTSTGAKTISGTFYFSVCNAETCQIKKQPMSVTVNVE